MQNILSNWFFVNDIRSSLDEKWQSELCDFIDSNKNLKPVVIHGQSNIILKFLDYLKEKVEIQDFFDTDFGNIDLITVDMISKELNKLKKTNFYIFEKLFLQMIRSKDYDKKLQEIQSKYKVFAF